MGLGAPLEATQDPWGAATVTPLHGTGQFSPHRFAGLRPFLSEPEAEVSITLNELKPTEVLQLAPCDPVRPVLATAHLDSVSCCTRPVCPSCAGATCTRPFWMLLGPTYFNSTSSLSLSPSISVALHFIHRIQHWHLTLPTPQIMFPWMALELSFCPSLSATGQTEPSWVTR